MNILLLFGEIGGIVLSRIGRFVMRWRRRLTVLSH